jgi:hypothetical protein
MPVAIAPIINREHIALTGQIPNGLQLIVDSMPLQVIELRKNVIAEDSGSKTPVMRCTGIFQRADEKNANGRVYPLKVLKDAIQKLQPLVKSRRVLGEWDHPDSAKIHLDRTSHLVTKLWMEGKTCFGEIEVINDSRSPCGSQLSCLLERNIQIGVSSRGVGDMEIVMREGEDTYEVQEGYEIVTFDAVAEPSVSGTQLKRLAEERERLLRRRMSPQQLREAREKLLIRELNKLLVNHI